MSLPITLSEPSTSTVTVSASIVVVNDGDATGGPKALPGIDYKNTPSPRNIVFTPGASGFTPTTKYFTVTVFPDTDPEPYEFILVRLDSVSATHTISRSDGIISLQDDDAEPLGTSFSVGDGSVVEGDLGKRVVKVPVTLSDPTSEEVLVDYTITGLSATCAKVMGTPAPGVDCNDLGGVIKTLKFKPGLATGLTPVVKYIPVQVFADFDFENATETNREIVIVTLSNPRPAAVGSELSLNVADGEGIVTIYDDDTPPPS